MSQYRDYNPATCRKTAADIQREIALINSMDRIRSGNKRRTRPGLGVWIMASVASVAAVGVAFGAAILISKWS